MASQNDPLANIQRLAIGPRDDSVLEQRQITVQSFRSTVALTGSLSSVHPL